MRTIYVTCSTAEWTQDEDGNPEDSPLEEHGWIDTNWSRTTLYEDRSDVSPLWTELDYYQDCDPTASLTKSAAAMLTAFGPVESAGMGCGTFYAVDAYQPLDSNVNYSYALHCEGFSDNELNAICALLTTPDH